MVLGNFPVPGRPTILITLGQGPYCACSRCGWGWFGHFYFHLSCSSFSLSFGDGPIKTEILSQRAVKPKTTNHKSRCNATYLEMSVPFYAYQENLNISNSHVFSILVTDR